MRISDWSSDVCSSDLAADVPDLLEVEVFGALGGFHSERRVAARAAAAGDVVALLGVFGQREERLEHTVGVVDQRLRDAVVADAGKAPFAVGRAEFVDERLAVLRAGRVGESADVECRDSGWRSEEHTSELQSLMRISYAVFCV